MELTSCLVICRFQGEISPYQKRYNTASPAIRVQLVVDYRLDMYVQLTTGWCIARFDVSIHPEHA
jgi:hypothetical protein